MVKPQLQALTEGHAMLAINSRYPGYERLVFATSFGKLQQCFKIVLGCKQLALATNACTGYIIQMYGAWRDASRVRHL